MTYIMNFLSQDGFDKYKGEVHENSFSQTGGLNPIFDAIRLLSKPRINLIANVMSYMKTEGQLDSHLHVICSSRITYVMLRLEIHLFQ
jgi:hypothetical protein